jgi:hypothetical protein
VNFEFKIIFFATDPHGLTQTKAVFWQPSAGKNFEFLVLNFKLSIKH